ncbi:SANT domain-containing protein [Psidium guajava]|nr:SANT domain-containing protein [Psidium guajava]
MLLCSHIVYCECSLTSALFIEPRFSFFLTAHHVFDEMPQGIQTPDFRSVFIAIFVF